MNQTDVDVSHLVDAAFEEQECISREQNVSCSGNQAAYGIAHNCMAGFLCAAHFKNYVESLRPWQREVLESRGRIRCKHCGNHFTNLDRYSKVYPL